MIGLFLYYWVILSCSIPKFEPYYNVLQCVAVCCSALQCVAVWSFRVGSLNLKTIFGVLQCVEMLYSAW